MQKAYDLSKARRLGHGAGSSGRRQISRSSRDREDDDFPLTVAQVKELRRRVADMRDRTRYLLISHHGPRFSLYYNVSSDCYAMNDPSGGTLFKRRQAAEAIRRLIGSRILLVKCRTVRRNGVLLPVLPRKFGRWRRGRKSKSR